jgi:hypothetical protein
MKAEHMPAPVGLLLVHGIGSQQPGETLDGFLGGMRLAYGDTLRVERRETGHARMAGVGRPVHVFEVYWADLLHGPDVEGSFDPDRIQEVVWFPWMNLQSGQLPASSGSRLRVRVRTWVLVTLGVLLTTGLMGAHFIASLMHGALQAIRQRQTQRGTRVTARDAWANVRRAAKASERRRRTALDEVLDQVVGDVFNYVHGVAGSFPDDTDQNRRLVANVAAIRARFVQAAVRAGESGCEELQILAHSLGTVVAFHGLCPPAPARLQRPAVRVTRLYTIGSPLEKVRFFWPRLVVGGPASHVVRWDNFFSPFDLVSGALHPFAGWPEPANHPVTGLGGFVTAHVAYHRNPGFLAFVGEGLTGQRPIIRLTWSRRLTGALQTFGETLLLPGILVGLSLLGLVTMVGFAWAVGWVISRPIDWVGLPLLASLVQYYVPAAIFFVMTVGGAIVGRMRARELYVRHWSSIPDPQADPSSV